MSVCLSCHLTLTQNFSSIVILLFTRRDLLTLTNVKKNFNLISTQTIITSKCNVVLYVEYQKNGNEGWKLSSIFVTIPLGFLHHSKPSYFTTCVYEILVKRVKKKQRKRVINFFSPNYQMKFDIFMNCSVSVLKEDVSLHSQPKVRCKEYFEYFLME